MGGTKRAKKPGAESHCDAKQSSRQSSVPLLIGAFVVTVLLAYFANRFRFSAVGSDDSESPTMAREILLSAAAAYGTDDDTIPVVHSWDQSGSSCLDEGYGEPLFAQCSPSVLDRCGRVVIDHFVSAQEVAVLKALVHKGMAYGGGSGGPTILDLVSGALSYQKQFISVYAAMSNRWKSTGSYEDVFDPNDAELLSVLIERIRQTVIDAFKLPVLHDDHGAVLHLANPIFFSRIEGGKQPQIPNDEYWHRHVDRVTYEAFDYTGLLYLSDAGTDFEGGEFAFIDDTTHTEQLIEPVSGRLLLFSSGAENPHRVLPVSSGTRTVLTLSFTCNAEVAQPDDFFRQRVQALVGDEGRERETEREREV